MDSNTPDAEVFKETLMGLGIMTTNAVHPESKTVAKSRTFFQTQVRKTNVLDISLKDFIVAWTMGHKRANCLEGMSISSSREDGKDDFTRPLPLVSYTEQFPEIKREGDATGEHISMLMPTAQWPFDHSMVIAAVNI